MEKKNFERIKDESIKELSKALQRAGLSKSWAAEKLEVTPSTIGRIFAGTYRPSLEMALNMKSLSEAVNKLNEVRL